MRLFIASLILAGLSTSVSASVFQLNVAGNLDGAYFGGYREYNTPYRPGGSIGLIAIDEPNSQFYSPNVFDSSGSGSVLIDSSVNSSFPRISNCSGILSWICSFGSLASFDEDSGSLSTSSQEGGARASLGPFTNGSIGSFSLVREWGLGSFPQVLDFSGATYSFETAHDDRPQYQGEYTGRAAYFGFGFLRLDYNLTSYEISAVPLPTSMPLLAFAFGGLGFLGARRKKRRIADHPNHCAATAV